MLTGDNNSTIDMTGGTGINPQLFSVTLILIFEVILNVFYRKSIMVEVLLIH